MKIQEKLKFIEDNHLAEWIKTRNEVADNISNKQSVFCVCGKLATGLHESYCRKLSAKINKETLKKLEHLFKK
jgi:hypothetical protein